MLSAMFNAVATLPIAGVPHDSGPWDSEWWWLWRITMFLVLIALVALTFWLTRRYSYRAEPSGVERARGILAERYARGEIDAEEYRRRSQELR